MQSALIGPWRRMGEGKERAIERVGKMAAADRARRPADGGWGAIDVIEHLVLVETGIASALAKEPNPERPRALGAGGRFPFWVVRLVLLGGIRYKVPVESVHPRGGIGWEEVAARWAAQREGLGRWLEGVSPEIILAPRFKHPLSGWLAVSDALTFAADHLVHHLGQLGRIEKGLRRGPG